MKCNDLGLKVVNNNSVDNNSYVRIDNYGAYIMRFTLTYYISPSVGIVLESGDMYAGDQKRLEYPSSAIMIHLVVEVEMFVDIYRTFFDKTFNTTEKRCYEAYGATINAYLVQKQCPQFDNSYFNVWCVGFVVCRAYADYITPDGKETKLDSGDIYISQSRYLYYPPNIVSVRFIIQVAQFIGVYKTFLDKTYNTADRRCFTVSGPVADPDIRQVECTVLR